jgi:hypothetical protein
MHAIGFRSLPNTIKPRALELCSLHEGENELELTSSFIGILDIFGFESLEVADGLSAHLRRLMSAGTRHSPGVAGAGEFA